MHIIIAAITAIAGLLWALNSLQRSGFDLNSLNPFFWLRRRQWAMQQVDPLYAIQTGRELAAVLMFAVLRQGGDPTAEAKAHLLKLYDCELNYSPSEASEMYAVASHLVSTDPNYMHKVGDIVSPALDEMTGHQKSLAAQLVKQMSTATGEPNDVQKAFLLSVESALGLG